MQIVMVDAMFGDYLLAREGFSRDELAELRRRVHAARVGERMQLLVTEALLWEFAGLGVRDRAKYDRLVMTLADLTGGTLLASWVTRGLMEVSERATPPLERAMVPRQDAHDIWYRYAMDDDNIRWFAERTRDAKRQHVSNERDKRARTIDAMEEAQVGELAVDPDLLPWRERLFDNPDVLIDSWTDDSIRDFAAEYEIPEPEGGWPTPADAKAFRWRKALHVARIRGVLTNGYSPTNPGLLDVEHLANACVYSDVYVSQDGGVRRLAADAVTPMRTVSFDDWAREILAT